MQSGGSVPARGHDIHYREIDGLEEARILATLADCAVLFSNGTWIVADKVATGRILTVPYSYERMQHMWRETIQAMIRARNKSDQQATGV